MNKQLTCEIAKLEALRDMSEPSCSIPDSLADYAARAFTAMHRAAGAKVQREIEQSIDKCGVWHRIHSANGVLTALADR